MAAEKGDLGLMLMLLAFFCFIAPPVVIGRLPGRWLGVSEMLRDELNKDVLKTEDHEDRLAYFVSMAVSFLVSAATVVITFL